jgi:hypothetical protein
MNIFNILITSSTYINYEYWLLVCRGTIYCRYCSDHENRETRTTLLCLVWYINLNLSILSNSNLASLFTIIFLVGAGSAEEEGRDLSGPGRRIWETEQLEAISDQLPPLVCKPPSASHEVSVLPLLPTEGAWLLLLAFTSLVGLELRFFFFIHRWLPLTNFARVI